MKLGLHGRHFAGIHSHTWALIIKKNTYPQETLYLNFKRNFHHIAQSQLGIYGDQLMMNQSNIKSIFF